MSPFILGDASTVSWTLATLQLSDRPSPGFFAAHKTTKLLPLKALLTASCVPRFQPPGANRFHQGCMVALGLVGIGGRKFREG
jgi:hypothetical protein